MIGKKVETIPIESLKFDPLNPRLPATVEGDNEKAVLEWMLKEESIIELMGSIGQHGYFPGEPLLVVPDSSKKGIFVVVEGNRRLAAAKLLANPNLAPSRRNAIKEASENAKHIDKLPALKYDDRTEVLDYLGYRHITGIKQWSALAKAKYLQQLYELQPNKDNDQARFKNLAKSIGSRSDAVAKSLTSLAIYTLIQKKDFFGVKGLDESDVEFSLIPTALSYRGIVNFIGLESVQDITLKGLKEDCLEELTRWIFERNADDERRVAESRNLEELNAVVKNKEALDGFRKGLPLAEAILLTEVPTEAFRSAVLSALVYLRTAQSHIHRVSLPTTADAEALNDVQQIASDLLTLIQKRISRATKS